MTLDTTCPPTMNQPTQRATTIGELCAGYGGLGMGVSRVIDAEVAWYSEIDKGALKVLEHRFPGVPNIGDMTTADWANVPPVDILTGGTPCQDLSHAGKRAGMTEGTRSNLWVAMREAIAVLRPSLVIWENVGGAYSAEADSELVSDPRLLADTRRRDGQPVLRALGRVLGDLASLGYVGGWHGLRAADVGAPHGRLRVFVVARDPHEPRLEGWGIGGERPRERAPRPTSSQPALLPTPAAYDGDRGGPQHPDKRRDGGHSVSLQDAVHGLLPTPRASWGEYEAAIRRWEGVLGRCAPPPTMLSTKGTPQLSPRFSEFMMGLPAGWVTDTPHITRNEALRSLGNGVVPQQAAAAVAYLLDVLTRQQVTV